MTKGLECGCESCLIILSANEMLIPDKGYMSWDDAPEEYNLYKETFNDPKFNPRWEQGTADYAEILGV